ISRRELFPKQMAAVNKALEIDDRLGEAHISLAISLMLNEWDWKNSEKEFREISLAVELDPVSLGILKDKGIYYYYSRQYDLAINMAMMTLELDPGFVPSYRLLSLAYEG